MAIMVNLKHVLSEIVNGRSNYCCLCFNVSKQELYFTTDKIFADQVEKQLSEMITSVLGDQYIDNMSISSSVCKGCVKNIIAFNIFTQTCQKNAEALCNVVTRLQDHFESKLEDEYKTVHVCLYRDHITEFYDHDTNNTSTELVKEIHKVYRNVTIDFELEQENAKPIKVKKQMVPLSEIVYDNNDRVYKCKDCLKMFPNKQCLKAHYVRTHVPKEFKCQQCPKSYGSQGLLDQHQAFSHCPTICPECGKICTRHNFRYHIRLHSTKFQCEYCGKILKSQRSYNSHARKCLQLETTNTKFICDYCNNSYAHKSMLRLHIKEKHVNVNVLACNWCDKKFACQSKLKAHSVTHTKEKDFVCDVCSHRFVTRTTLLHHKRLHSGARPYKCNLCDKTFVSHAQRTGHMKRIHLPPMFQCDICNTKWTVRSKLNQHRLKHFNPSSKLYREVLEPF